jgi:hypothetical protein
MAAKGTHVPASGTARTRRWPSQRSIKSSPERRNNSSDAATSNGAGNVTRNSNDTDRNDKDTVRAAGTLAAHEKAVRSQFAQLFEGEANAALDGAQGQAGGIRDRLLRLAL